MPKRAAAGAGTIRKKTITRKGKQYTYWEARITTGYDPGTGKQIQQSFSGKTQKEVREKLQAAAVEVNKNCYIEPSKMTLGQWLDEWVSGLYNQKASTIKHYKAQIKTHIKPAMGAIPLQQLSKSDFDKFYKYLLESGKTVKKKGKASVKHEPLSMKSVHNIHVILRAAITAALDADKISADPMRKVKLKAPPKPEMTPLTDQQVGEYIAATYNDPLGSILRLLVFTGMREGEAMGLTWDCIDFKKGSVNIRQQLQDLGKANGGMTIVPTKNDKSRQILPAPYVMELLKDQQREQIEKRLLAGEHWQGWKNEKDRKTSLVFTNELGRPLRPKTVYQHHKKVCAACGIDGVRVHDLRHTFAVLSLENGDDIKTLQATLGHATAAFTLDKYGHVSERMKNESAERMEAFIKSIEAV